MTKKILITGYKGQLGQECVRVMNNTNELICTDYEELDITDFSSVKHYVEKFKPEIIINCAAYTRVDDCETYKEQAFNLNVNGPENLARVSESAGITLIHISTDYVFDGLKPLYQPYTENDVANPISYYGKTKFEGEQKVRQITQNHVIIRTAWLYSIYGNNFLKTMLKLALAQKSIRVVNDQFGTPTWAYRLALQIQKIIETNIKGTFHVTGENYCSWFDLASYFFKQMNISHTIKPCTTQEYPTLAKRPANSILENQRLKALNSNIMLDWKDDIDQFVDQLAKSSL